MKLSNQGFTLIEMLVGMTLLGIIMVSVFTIFFLSSDLNNKTDISRAMQENVKHIVETIAEDIRSTKSGISVDSSGVGSGCAGTNPTGNKLCVGGEYYLQKDGSRIIDISVCQEKNSSCVLVKNGQALSNSWVEFENLEFTVFENTNPQKIQVNFTIRPSAQKNITINHVEKNTIHFQTTFSKRIY